MRAIVTTLLALTALALEPTGLLCRGLASANPGDKIGQFLQVAQQDHLGLDFWHLTPAFNSAYVGSTPPTGDFVNRRLRIIDGGRGGSQRTVLKQALQVLPEAPDATFQPDYCVIYRNAEKDQRILWIQSDPADLQMQFRASDGTSDQCRITEGTPGNVGQMLRRLMLSSVSNAITQMVNGIDYLALPFDVMAIDPKEANDVFGHKRRNVLGTVSIIPDDIEKQATVTSAIIWAIDFPPAYTAHSFTPRLAVAVKVPSLASVWMHFIKLLPNNLRTLLQRGESAGSLLVPPNARFDRQPSCYQYVVLMSFECRLAELYVDGKSQGFCALVPGRQKPIVAGLPVEVALDQFLNDILVAAHQPLKPKSTSSGN